MLWLPVALHSTTHRVGIGWIQEVPSNGIFSDFCGLLGSYLLGYRVWGVDVDDRWSLFFGWVYYPCLVSAGLLMLWPCLGSRNTEFRATPPEAAPHFEVSVFLAMWLFAPICGALIFSWSVYSLWGVPRYLIGCAPALMLLLSAALASHPHSHLPSVVGIGILAVNVALLAFDRSHCTRTPWREVARTMDAAALAAPDLESFGSSAAERGIVVTCLNGHRLDFPCLEHELSGVCRNESPVRLFFLPLNYARWLGKSFFLLEQCGSGRMSDIEPALRGGPGRFRLKKLYSSAVFEERFTAMPDPVVKAKTELWLCVPEPE
jgi:hypothetical protein